MADSIVRLKVESQEYDQKLKRAAEGLNRYADECRKVGGTLEVVEKDTLEYVRTIGQMDTVSRTATGKLAEMKKTFMELSAQYKNLTEEEKNSPFGKALAQSLSELKDRISTSQSQIKDIGNEMNNTGSIMSQLTDKLTVNIDAFKLLNVGLDAAKVALEVAKDAFFASEATVDEWGRVMDSSKSLYEGFLTALNTGDISGYLNRIDSIVQAARTAYNELDRLGTMKTIQAPHISAQQTENERMRMMIQTGRYIAPVDGRKAAMKNGQLLTPEQIKRIERNLQGGMQKMVTLVGNEVAQTSRAIDAVYNRQAQELGMSLKEFRKGTSSMAEFDKRMAGYQNYEQWRKDNSFTDAWGNRQVRPGNPYEEYKKWNTFRVDGDRYHELVQLIQQRDQQAGQAYSMQSQAYRTMNRAEGITVRQIMGGGSDVGGSSTNNLPTLTEDKDDFEEIIGLIPNAEEAVRSLQQQIRESWDEGEIEKLSEDLRVAQAEVERLKNLSKGVDLDKLFPTQEKAGKTSLSRGEQMVQDIRAEIGFSKQKTDINTLRNLLEYTTKNAIEGINIPTDMLLEKIIGDGFDIPDEYWIKLEKEINTKTKEMGLDPISLDVTTGEVSGGEGIQNLVSGVNSGVDTFTQIIGIMKGIQSVLDDISSNTSRITGGLNQMGIKTPEWINKATNFIGGMGNVLGGITGFAGMFMSGGSISKLTKMFHDGGIVRAAGGYKVPGNYGYDAVPALLTSGELVLNSAQQNYLATELSNRGNDGGNIGTASIQGEQIFITLNNYLRRRGYGELLTTR